MAPRVPPDAATRARQLGARLIAAGLVVVVLSALVMATQSWLAARPAPDGANAVSEVDRTFLREAAALSFAEIMAARLAVKEGGDADLKDFARKLIDEQSSADEALQALARRKGVSLPHNDAADATTLLADLRGLKAQPFERVYASEAGVAGLRRGLALFEREARQGSDPDVRDYARRGARAWQRHLATAEALAAERPRA